MNRGPRPSLFNRDLLHAIGAFLGLAGAMLGSGAILVYLADAFGWLR